MDYAIVSDNARIDNSAVMRESKVGGYALIEQRSRISGNAKVSGKANVKGSIVGGNATIRGDASLFLCKASGNFILSSGSYASRWFHSRSQENEFCKNEEDLEKK